MRTLGVDLSANPVKTGVCQIDWDAGTVELTAPPVTDEQLVALIADVDLAGIDVPLGWPDAFVDAVAAHHVDQAWPVMDLEPPLDREPLRYRVTDRLLQEQGFRPLSVSSDLIGVPTMRGARLQHLLRDAGVTVDRSGTAGRIAEVYPAAALRTWGLTSTGYKGKANAAACGALAAALAQRCGRLSDAVTACLDGCDDDGLDALVCAVLARAVLQQQTGAPPPGRLVSARREGWIHVPTASLEDVIGA